MEQQSSATDTIVALSSGSPPAAIGVLRLSGPQAGTALAALAGALPAPRRASLRTLRDASGEVLDEALVLWLPGPNSATGEDTAELHCHGGRAILAAVEQALVDQPGVRRAAPGEFTRRAFANGRIDLAQAEALSELLFAETELQRRVLQASAGGVMSERFEGWRDRVLAFAAQVESVLDFSDEDDVADLPAEFFSATTALAEEVGAWLAKPRAERLREGVRVVLAGPPNAGKSTLFNALLQHEAAIVSPQAGTTRDVLERPVAIDGVLFTLADTAGLHAGGEDTIERIGIDRARQELERADIVLWLGPEGEGPEAAWEIEAMCDRPDHAAKSAPRHRLSAQSGEGVDALLAELGREGRALLPRPSEGAINARQHALLAQVSDALAPVSRDMDLLVLAEHLRQARVALDQLLGRATTEDMLDALFGRFCIGK